MPSNLGAGTFKICPLPPLVGYPVYLRHSGTTLMYYVRTFVRGAICTLPCFAVARRALPVDSPID